MPKARASLLMMVTTALTVAVLFLIPFTPETVVQTVRVQEGSVVRSAFFSGTVAYHNQQPCIALTEGVISKVYAKAGATVGQDDLLFLLDTSLQQKALSTLYGQQHGLMHAAESVAALAEYGAWAQQEQQLRTSIEAAQIRAEAGGVVDAVYAKEGMLVEAGTVLGRIRGEEKCVITTGKPEEIATLSAGAAAALSMHGRDAGAAWLESVSAPMLTNAAQQTLVFCPQTPEQLSKANPGDRVLVEAMVERIDGCVPIPLAAVDSENQVWYVEQGKAQKMEIDVSRRSSSAVAAPLEWAGRSVILSPETANLQEGCAVKEAKPE